MKILRETTDNGLMFWCPGCDGAHRIQHGAGSGPRWSWNGDVEKPTFQPSILVTSYEMTPEAELMIEQGIRPEPPGSRYPGHATRCHSFVTDGRIRFLGDCTHALAGQTVDIPDWETA